MTYLDCWISSATALFSQALAGEPELVDSLPRPMGGSLAFTATVSGDQEGRFTEADQRLLSTIASAVGVALHNAKLFEEARQARAAAEEADAA